MTMRIWFPLCMSCKEITSFAGREDLAAEKITCRLCNAVCEDAHALQQRGELTMKFSEESWQEYMRATDKEIERQRDILSVPPLNTDR